MKIFLLKLFSKLHLRSLLIKNFTIILILSLTVNFAVIYTFSGWINNIVKSEMVSLNYNAISGVKNLLDNILQSVNYLATDLSLRDEVNSILLLNNSKFKASDTSQVSNIVSLFSNNYDYLNSIYIFSEENQIIITNSGVKKFNEFNDNNWYEDYKNSQSNNRIITTRVKNNFYPYLISVIKPIYYGNKEKLGAVIVNIDIEKLADYLNEPEKDIYIINSYGKVVLSHYQNEIFNSIYKIPILNNINYKKSSSSIERKTEDKDVICSFVQSDLIDWTYFSVHSLEYYENKINLIQKYVFRFLILCIAIVILISFLISFRTYQPVKSIVSIFKELEKKDSNIHKVIQKLNSVEELNFIIQNIIESEDSKNRLKKELQLKLLLLNNAQTVALQAQINPHFLYNTLDAIRWKSFEFTGSDNDVSNMVTSLSELFRISLDTKEYLVSLEKEIEHVKLYMEVMKYRYKNLVEVIWDIPENLIHYNIVKFSLQPIVENAIYHGIKPKRQKGIITINARKTKKELLININDDGIGMDAQKLKAVNSKINKSYRLSSNHIGIQNVNQRYKMIFKEGAGIFISSTKDTGTTVSIRIPEQYLTVSKNI